MLEWEPTPEPALAAPTPRPARETTSARLRRHAVTGSLALAAVVAATLAVQGYSSGTEARLDPRLASAIGDAQAQAAQDGVELTVTSGLRTAAEQDALYAEAVDEHGADDAPRWVLPADRSPHVRGRAVDVGPVEGREWLVENGARWGLCQVYDNEPWHFELRTEPGGECPERMPDASVDERR